MGTQFSVKGQTLIPLTQASMLTFVGFGLECDLKGQVISLERTSVFIVWEICKHFIIQACSTLILGSMCNVNSAIMTFNGTDWTEVKGLFEEL